MDSYSFTPTQIAPTCCLQTQHLLRPPVPHNLWPQTINLHNHTHTQTCLMITRPVATCPTLTPRPTNQTPTHTAVSLRLVTQRAGVMGLRRRDCRLWGWDDGRRARKAQVPSIVVEALHFSFAGIWNGLTLVYV